MDVLGTHLLIELRRCENSLLDDIRYIKEAMVGAANEAGASIVGESFHKFSPRGVTGIVAIAESHLCIHTWPEHGYAAVDIFRAGRRSSRIRPHNYHRATAVPAPRDHGDQRGHHRDSGRRPLMASPTTSAPEGSGTTSTSPPIWCRPSGSTGSSTGGRSAYHLSQYTTPRASAGPWSWTTKPSPQRWTSSSAIEALVQPCLVAHPHLQMCSWPAAVRAPRFARSFPIG